jgi:BCD family chlorophyll transporter-like MFS transporter
VRPLDWLSILRLGLVQTALGAVVVLTTSTLNRVMVIELSLPAMVPGALVALHYGVQVLRPRWGHGLDAGRRVTPWIVGGMAVLALGGFGAAIATAIMRQAPLAGIVLATTSFALIGAGVGASGTSLLVLLAKCVDGSRRAAAATIVWVMMIAGFVVTAGVAGQLLDPFSPQRLVAVAGCVSAIAFAISLLAVWGIEPRGHACLAARDDAGPSSFLPALMQVWNEPQARRFAIFVFISMLAYSAQDLILEPFAGNVFGFTPGESTKLSGVQHSGVLAGMLLVAFAGTIFGGRDFGASPVWTVGGCIASALALLGLAAASLAAPSWPLRASVFALGATNGAYAVAAIGSMMSLVGAGGERREGVRMGLWGAAQAIAFGVGGFLGTLAADIARYFTSAPSAAYGLVFAGEAALFLASASLAARVMAPRCRARAFDRMVLATGAEPSDGGV